MATFMAPVTTAFTVTEVMGHARSLSHDLGEAEYRGRDLWDIVEFWERLGNAAWVPRLLDIPRQKRLDSLIAQAPLSLHRSMHSPREESITAVTPGVLNSLRERINDKMAEVDERNSPYIGLSDAKLWQELEQEGAVDYLFKSVRSNFELRGCAQCGRWYEPQLANRGRFCSGECRKRFNNVRNSVKEEVKNFTCNCCNDTRSMDQFSGLLFEASTDEISPLRIGPFRYHSESQWCLECVESQHKEWARYIAPLVEARDARERVS